jgi:hypothetical protein
MAIFGRRASRQTESSARRCSFCNRTARKVPRLIAGPKIYICSDCVATCQDILVENRILERGSAADEEARNRERIEIGQALFCALCDNLIDLISMVQVPYRGWICRACLDLVQRVEAFSVQ